jgi:hypothetical protein
MSATFSKADVYDRGCRILDVTCWCGKYLQSRIGYRDHLRAKHPRQWRRMKKAGEWAQIEIEWLGRGRHGDRSGMSGMRIKAVR